MPSRAESARRIGEHVLRAASLALLAWMAWWLLRPLPTAQSTVATERTLAARLPEWTLGPAPQRVHAVFDTVPAAATRDWLRALERSGMALGWSARAVPAIAVEVGPIAEPRGGAHVFVSAPGDQRVTLRDDLGVLDSASSEGGGVVFALPRLEGGARAAIGAHVARAPLTDSLRLGSVVVIGRASWETRFVAEALEERGWRVEARQVIAPGLEALRGRDASLDTSRVSAVIAVDSTATRDAARIGAFVRSGGGLVLLADAARAPALATLAPGRVGSPVRPTRLAFASDAPRRSLVLHPIGTLRGDAVVLERGSSGVAAAARRIGSGRVVLLGYENSWRWRLSGGRDAPAAHRDWWSRVVASVAHRSEYPVLHDVVGDAAPLAALTDALGPPSAEPAAVSSGAASRTLPIWMLVLVLAMLLAEWGSRRLRGAR
jgi:hypothetical protein